MRFFRFLGGYTDLSQTALASYHAGLQNTYGFVAVGLPVYRSFASGILAGAFYEDATITLRSRGAQVTIIAHLGKSVNFASFKTFTANVFGLTMYSITEDAEK